MPLTSPAVVLSTVNKVKTGPANISVPGELVPYQEVELYAKINSYVKKLWVDIGSQVHHGDNCMVHFGSA